MFGEDGWKYRDLDHYRHAGQPQLGYGQFF